MMKSDVIKSDNRLLLFRALEYGLKTTLIDDALIEKFKREGSDMSFAFAKRYYNVIYEAYLRHASHCVLGIMNLGLIEASGNHLPNAAALLLKEGAVGTFREGWARIINLVQYAMAADYMNQKTEFEWEKDFADSLSAEPDRRWIGYDEYRYNMLLYSKKEGRKVK